VNSTLDGIDIYGYVSNLSFTRGNSSLQIFFVNGRYIKSDIIKDALKIAYKTMIPINRHPICFLNFDIDYKEIDVNIHPSKTEIKFSRVGIIKQLIYTTIKAKLFEYNQTPIVSLENEMFENTFKTDKVKEFKVNEDKENINNNFQKKVNKNPFTNNEYIENKNHIIEKEKVIDLDIFDIDFEKLDKKEFVFEKEKIKKDETIYDNLKIIGQLFTTYILCEKDDNLYLLDQHAGHEKVIYEQLMDEYMNKTISSQLLFIPIQIKLSYNELEIIISKKNILNDLGFNVEIFGKDTLLVREVPILFNQPLKEDIVKNIILNLKEEYKNVYETNTELIIQKSCKNAIKAYDKLDILEIGELIDSLKKLDSPYTCPHGRPIIISISKNEIEKKFKRK
jgi:DNA mismatch repair protein MutL